MKCIRKVLIFVLLSVLILSSVAYGENTVQHNDKAQVLNNLGLLKGTDKGYELEKASTRAESAAMIVRLLGKEKSVLESKFSHPFKDVPQWADPYIGYMYEMGLTTGISNDSYGSYEILDSKSYMTFILRVLGYNDSKGDFQWAEALTFANKIGILTNEELRSLQGGNFNRDGMILITYNSLKTKLKDNEDSLLSYLTKNLIISLESVYNSGLQDSIFVGTIDGNLSLKDGMPYLKLLLDFGKNTNIKDVYFARIVGSSPNKPDIEQLLSRMTYSNSEKDEIRKRYNREKWIKDGGLELLEERQRFYHKSPSAHYLLVLFDENLYPVYYAEIPNNLEIGGFEIPLLEMDKRFQDEIRQDEKVMKDFVDKYMAQIKIISRDAVKIVEEGSQAYAVINRNLLPEGAKDFKHASTTGIYVEGDLNSFETQRNELEGSLKDFWDFNKGLPIYERDIKDNKILLRYKSYITILLFSENEEPVGFIVFSRY